MVYLDNSATSYPKPKSVYHMYKNAIKYYYSNPGRGGYENALLCAEKIYETRKKIADFFGESNEENVVFTANCTAAVNLVMKGLLKSGDHVLISDLEHNAVLRCVDKLRRESGIKYDIFQTDFYDDEKTLQSVKKLVQPNTKLIFCTHASNVLGVCLPIAKIGAFCYRHGITFAVDAAQSGGILPLNMAKMHIDFLCLAPHKGLFAPMGTGIFIGDGTKLNTLIEGGTGSHSVSRLQPDFMPDKLEAGTMNTGGILAIGAGIDFIRHYGRETVFHRDKQHILHLFDGLQQVKNCVLYLDYRKLGTFSPAISFNLKNIPSEIVAENLAQKHIFVRAGLHCAPLAHQKIGTIDSGTVRLSPSFFTKDKDINYTINTIKKL